MLGIYNTISHHVVREGGKSDYGEATTADTRWLQKSQQYVIDEKQALANSPLGCTLRHVSCVTHLRAEQETVMETSLPTYPLDSREKNA